MAMRIFTRKASRNAQTAAQQSVNPQTQVKHSIVSIVEPDDFVSLDEAYGSPFTSSRVVLPTARGMADALRAR